MEGGPRSPRKILWWDELRERGASTLLATGDHFSSSPRKTKPASPPSDNTGSNCNPFPKSTLPDHCNRKPFGSNRAAPGVRWALVRYTAKHTKAGFPVREVRELTRENLMKLNLEHIRIHEHAHVHAHALHRWWKLTESGQFSVVHCA